MVEGEEWKERGVEQGLGEEAAAFRLEAAASSIFQRRERPPAPPPLSLGGQNGLGHQTLPHETRHFLSHQQRTNPTPLIVGHWRLAKADAELAFCSTGRLEGQQGSPNIVTGSLRNKRLD